MPVIGVNKRYSHHEKILIILTILLATLSSEALQPRHGYRGFLSGAAACEAKKFAYPGINGNLMMYRENTFYTGFSTSHGYQINPMFFIGAGLGMENAQAWITGWHLSLFKDA